MKKFLTAPLLLLALSCGSNKENYDPDNKNGLITFYHKDGSISQQTNYKNNVKEGIEKIYFRKGDKVRKEIPFVHGEVQGIVKEYYDDGSLHQETTFNKGKKDGIVKTWFRSGKLQSQITYHDGFPGSDLIEFNEDGAPVKNNLPAIHIEAEDRTKFKGEYALIASLSDQRKAVTFYEGKLVDDKFLNSDALLLLTTKDGVTEYISYSGPGRAIQKKLNFVAVVKSRYDNPIILQKSYDLNVANRPKGGY